MKAFINTAAILVMFLGSGYAQATTYYADASRTNDLGSGTSWTTAKQTLQAAVNLTVAGDSVLVTNGNYNIGETVTPGYSLTNRVCITNDIVVQSVNGEDVTFIEGASGTGSVSPFGDDAIRGVYMEGACVLIGFTITNGNTIGIGVGFDRGHDQSGGGVYVSSNEGIVSNCTITGCSALQEAGGVYMGTLYDCTISNNLADIKNGGGAYYSSLNNCILVDNESGDNGGGASAGTLNNCLVIRNIADLANGGSGGGCYNATLNNCTVSENRSGGYGGGTRYGSIYNSIVWGNTAVVSGQDIASPIGGISNTCASDGVADGVDGCITNNPLFVDTASGDYGITRVSACIDAGSNTNAPMPYDLAGNARLFRAVVDMGAYEWFATPANDFDGDGASDLGVLDQGTGRWFVRTVGGAQLAYSVNWGWAGVEGVAGDYDGDGVGDLAVFDQNTGRWFIRSFAGDTILWEAFWGWPGVEPVSGDFDGDGIDDLAVFDQLTGRWFIRSVVGDILAWNVYWGWPGVQPVSGDYDGDGTDDLAVLDQGTGRWFVRNLAGNILAWEINWGWAGVTGVSGDFDGDAKSDLAVFDVLTGRWFIRNIAGDILAWDVNWGWPSVSSVSGDFDGDGFSDLAIFDEASGRWFVRSLAGETISWNINWGWSGVQPVGR